MARDFHIQGRQVSECDIAQIGSLIKEHSQWSRRQISIAIAQLWDWRTVKGQIKDMAVGSLLLKLEQRSCIILPPRRSKSHGRKGPLVCGVKEESPIKEKLADLLPIKMEVVKSGEEDYKLFGSYLASYHYLGYRGPVGDM